MIDEQKQPNATQGQKDVSTAGSLETLRATDASLRDPVSVLVVEDDDNDYELLQYALNQLGSFQIARAGSGRQAIHLLMTREFKVVFLDLKLPCMRGIEVMAGITDKSKIIILTGFDEKAPEVIEAINLGASQFLKKPATVEKLRPFFSTPFTK